MFTWITVQLDYATLTVLLRRIHRHGLVSWILSKRISLVHPTLAIVGPLLTKLSWFTSVGRFNNDVRKDEVTAL